MRGPRPLAVAVVPVFNEAATVGAIVAGARRVCPVIVVDDASTDGSAERAVAAGAVRVLRHSRRLGKGAALRAGFAEALRQGAGRVATMDGDGQHDPVDLPRLLAASQSAPEALVIGDRLASPTGDPIPVLRLAAIRVTDWLLARVTRVAVRDTQCGFRVYPAALLAAVPLREEGFVLETEALGRAARQGYPVRSVPVRRVYPAGRQSRFRAVADGARIGRYVVSALAHRLAGGGRPGPPGETLRGTDTGRVPAVGDA